MSGRERAAVSPAGVPTGRKREKRETIQAIGKKSWLRDRDIKPGGARLGKRARNQKARLGCSPEICDLERASKEKKKKKGGRRRRASSSGRAGKKKSVSRPHGEPKKRAAAQAAVADDETRKKKGRKSVREGGGENARRRDRASRRRSAGNGKREGWLLSGRGKGEGGKGEKKGGQRHGGVGYAVQALFGSRAIRQEGALRAIYCVFTRPLEKKKKEGRKG